MGLADSQELLGVSRVLPVEPVLVALPVRERYGGSSVWLEVSTSEEYGGGGSENQGGQELSSSTASV